MQLDQLKPNVIVHWCDLSGASAGHCRLPMGNSVKLIGKALNTGKVHEPVLRFRRFENSRDVEVLPANQANEPRTRLFYPFPLILGSSECLPVSFSPGLLVALSGLLAR